MVAEAMRRDMHLKAEMQRVAGLERLLQRIDTVAEVVIHEHGRRGPVDGYSSGFDPRDGGHMDGVDRRGTGVREDVGATDLRLPPIGIDLDAKVGAREGWAARRPHTFRSAVRIRRAAPSPRTRCGTDCSTLVL